MTEPACIRCGGDEDLMDRGMAPGMTYCRPCRVRIAEEERVEASGQRCGLKTEDVQCVAKGEYLLDRDGDKTASCFGHLGTIIGLMLSEDGSVRVTSLETR